MRALFLAARPLTAADRTALLAGSDDDDTLIAAVRRLLRADDSLRQQRETAFLHSMDERAAALLESTAADDVDVLRPGDRLGRYRIERQIGRGGMGVVYRAHDTRLHRPSAVKLMPRDRSNDPDARRRFEVEARAASALDHPGIATIYEIGEGPDGSLFIAMAYCEGETLREELRHGPLAVERVRSLALGIAAALAAAHRRGIAHRDIKPGNIVVTPAGETKIVDFGIASTTHHPGAASSPQPGTLAYMSPEQLAGEAGDARADVWSLGVTLFELLTGHRPFEAGGRRSVASAVRAAHSTSIPLLRTTVPADLARIVERCLERDPADRYQDAEELFADLRATGPPPTGKTALRRNRARSAGAVLLAFMVLAAAALARDRATRLAAAPSRDEAPARTPVPRVAVLPLTDARRVQVGDPAGAQTPTNAVAYREYMMGRYYLGKLDRASFERARDHFRLALDADPVYAPAWSGLADAYSQLARMLALHWDAAWTRSRAAAERALALDDDLAEAHASLAAVLTSYAWESEAAEHHFRRALELDPGAAHAYRVYATHLRNHGRFADATAAIREARRLDPLSAETSVEAAVILYLEERHDAAADMLEELLHASPDVPYANFHLALIRAQQGRFAEAQAALDRTGAIAGNAHVTALRGVIHAMAGERAAAHSVLRDLHRRSAKQPVSPFHEAAIHAQLGNADRAFELLHEALRARSPAVRVVGVEPIFAPLRGDPRFIEFLRSAGLEPHSAQGDRDSR